MQSAYNTALYTSGPENYGIDTTNYATDRDVYNKKFDRCSWCYDLETCLEEFMYRFE